MKKIPFTREQLEEVLKDHNTPFHIYDEGAIRENLRKLKKAFSWNSGFKEFFEVKELPNPYIF